MMQLLVRYVHVCVPVAAQMPDCVLWKVVFTDWYCRIRLKFWRRLEYFVLQEDNLTIWNK